MITPAEIRAVPVFASLNDAEIERLARHAADLRLERGQYAVHEGDGRCLLIVLEGETEATKEVDGIERVLGRRVPGDLFGEVPLILGTAFPASLRATGPCRVMRVEPRDFHAVASVAPEFAAYVGRWDVDCRTIRTFLDRNHVSYEWVASEGLKTLMIEREAPRWTAERDPFLLETSVPGIFACGDVRSRSVKRVAAGVGEGSMSIAFVHQFLASAI